MWAKISSFFLNYIFNKLWAALSYLVAQIYEKWSYDRKVKEREARQKEALEKLKEVTTNPETTIEERSKAYEDAINSMR
jgi:hypothetical protein